MLRNQEPRWAETVALQERGGTPAVQSGELDFLSSAEEASEAREWHHQLLLVYI